MLTFVSYVVCMHRYLDEEEGDTTKSQDRKETARKSRGADLQDWLEQYPAQDPMFYVRQRVNLHEEIGLPPAETGTYEGLTMNLTALAECLENVPLHEVLRLPDFLKDSCMVTSQAHADPRETAPVKHPELVSRVDDDHPNVVPHKVFSEPTEARGAKSPQGQAPIEIEGDLAARSCTERYHPQSAGEDDEDAELDALLSMNVADQPSSSHGRTRSAVRDVEETGSLEDFLSAL